MIILDTNVVSELMRQTPHKGVLDWVDAQESRGLFVTAITEAELRAGAAYLRPGRRKEMLTTEIERMIAVDFAGRVLPFNSEATPAYASIAANRRSDGRPISEADCQIASIARSLGMALATRNVRDFEGCGAQIMDPWTR